MARFGRAQPHGPIFIRGPAAQEVFERTGSPIHIVQAGRQPAAAVRTTRSVVFIRAPDIPQVFEAPAVRLHITQTQRNPYRPYVSVRRARAPPAVIAIGASRITVVHG